MKEKNIKEKGKKRKAESKNILPENVLYTIGAFCKTLRLSYYCT